MKRMAPPAYSEPCRHCGCPARPPRHVKRNGASVVICTPCYVQMFECGSGPKQTRLC